MRKLLLYFSLFTIHFSLLAQQDSGFTNKADAKNLMVNGLKEGKWVEYYDSDWSSIPNMNTATYYMLTIYKKGKPNGIVHGYFMNGQLWKEIPYIYGIKNGVEKWYYESGQLLQEWHYKNGKLNGEVKEYYKSGKLSCDNPYINGKEDGVVKCYYENGVLAQEIPWKNGKACGVEKDYYENGKLKEKTIYDAYGEPERQIEYNENGIEIKK